MNNYLIRPYVFDKWAIYLLKDDGYYAKVVYCGEKEACLQKLREIMKRRDS